MSTASELRKPVYWIVAAKAIDYEQMLLLMAGVKWDIREIMSQHNVYVDVLLKVTPPPPAAGGPHRQREEAVITHVGGATCADRDMLLAPRGDLLFMVQVDHQCSTIAPLAYKVLASEPAHRGKSARQQRYCFVFVFFPFGGLGGWEVNKKWQPKDCLKKLASN